MPFILRHMIIFMALIGAVQISSVIAQPFARWMPDCGHALGPTCVRGR